MKYIEGTSREQLYLYTEKLDDLITRDNIIRFIDVYVDKLDLIKLKIHNINKTKGSPGYNPKLYLKIYIYCYLNRIRSSRKIEKACKVNIELIWLNKQLTPAYWAISNFRKQNKKALKKIFKEFLKFCHKLELLSFDCVAVDGTKMRANNSLSNIYKKDTIGKLLDSIDNKIDEYIKDLEENDKKEENEYEFLNSNIPKKLKNLTKHKDKIKFIEKIFDENPDLTRYFANDTDSSFQKDNGRCIAGYNCQTAVDEKNKLIISTDVTDENNDLHQLNNMKEKITTIKEELDVNDKTVLVADAGYHSESEIIEALKDEETDLYIPHPRDVKTKEKQGRENKNKIPAKGFEKEYFKYDIEKDLVHCPAGKILIRKSKKGSIANGVRKIRYRCMDCKECKKRHLCTTSSRGRAIEISENYKIMKEFQDKVKSKIGKKIIRKRKELAEHPFGTIKRHFGFRHFMQKNIENVKAEFSFISFIYNFKRILNIFTVEELINALN